MNKLQNIILLLFVKSLGHNRYHILLINHFLFLLLCFKKGPLVNYDLPLKNPEKKATLFGLTSTGECGYPTLPGIYARIDRVLNWIEQMNTTYYHA